MVTKTAPICYYPTTVALVDDSENYLFNLYEKLDESKTIYKAMSDAEQAYEFLKEAAKAPEFLNQCMRQERDPARGHRNIDINLFPIREQMYNPERFSQISVLVIDQEMPALKGLEICRKLKGTPIKKILLTGEIDDSQAIEAFNEGVIDQFISKSADNFYERINTSIEEQMNAYMRDVMVPITNSLAYSSPGYELSCLLEPKFIEKLEKIIHDNNICEYYLSDDNGSYIFLDSTGKPSWLVLKDIDEMEADYYLAEDSDTPPAKDVLQGLKDHKLILHLYTEAEQKDILAANWEKHHLLYPAQMLKGKDQNYYYAYIDNPNAHDIKQDEIVSFKAYQVSLNEKQ
jgi:CheY-like chemotaxis protein